MSTSISINPDLCNRCGACVRECPTRAMLDAGAEIPRIDDVHCLDCGHCGAVCVLGAIHSAQGDFPEWTAPKLVPDDARRFLLGRRSVRRYQNASIDHDTLRELLSVAPYAPTASNAQDVAAHVLTGEGVYAFAASVNDYYRSLERLLGLRVLWPLLWFTDLRPYLKSPSKIARVRERVRGFGRDQDWVFFGAPAVVVLSAPRKHRLFGRVNCTIAAERVQQYAFALGLGSCFIGYAEVAMLRRATIAASIGLSPDHVPGAVFSLGYPLAKYSRLPARRALDVTWNHSRSRCG